MRIRERIAAAICLLLTVGVCVPAPARANGMNARGIDDWSGVVRKGGGRPRRVRGLVVTSTETPADRTGYTLRGQPLAGGATLRVVVLLYRSGRDVMGAKVDGAVGAAALAPGGAYPRF